MLIGTMNHPGKEVLREIQWIAEMGFEYVDLTLEPPLASVQRIDLDQIRSALREHALHVVGHTAYYLPLCSPFESIRRATVVELRLCLEAFATLGATWMNLHPDRQAPLHDRRFIVEQNLRSIRELMPLARQLGIGLMIENLPGSFNAAWQVAELLEPLPELGLHLDIGHSNLLVESNTADDLISTYGKRIRHVHLHDNKGGAADLHLPLGAGTIEVRHYVRLLQKAGYDGTITLEVFTPDKHHLAYSRDLLRRLWEESRAAAREPPTPVKAIASTGGIHPI